MNKLNRLIISLVIILALLFSFSSCLPFYYYEKPHELELIGDVSMRYVYNEEFACYDVYLEGIAENITGKDMTGCSVCFIIYDNDGNVIGIADDYINNLKADAKWRFAASGTTGYEPARFELEELYGYDYNN